MSFFNLTDIDVSISSLWYMYVFWCPMPFKQKSKVSGVLVYSVDTFSNFTSHRYPSWVGPLRIFWPFCTTQKSWLCDTVVKEIYESFVKHEEIMGLCRKKKQPHTLLLNELLIFHLLYMSIFPFSSFHFPGSENWTTSSGLFPCGLEGRNKVW